jgi:hypothetical protein
MREGMTSGKDWRRAAARRFLVPLAIAIAGIVVVAVSSGTAEIVGGGLIAVTIAISLAFLEVGYSEDRAREREER